MAKVIFSDHAKTRCKERLNINHEIYEMMFEVELNKIFQSARYTHVNNDGALVYEFTQNKIKTMFICTILGNNDLLVKTVIKK